MASQSTVQVRYTSQPGPLVVHFPSGTPAPEALRPGNEDSLRLAVFTQAQRDRDAATASGSRPKHVVAAENGRMLYNSSSESSQPMTKYLVGVFDRKKHTLDVYDSDMFALKPTVKRMRSDALNKKQEAEGLSKYQQYTQKKNDLVEAFGGRKKKNELLTNIKNKIEDASLGSMAKNIQSTLDTAAKDDLTLNEVMDQADEHRPIPAFNADALSPDEVYPLENLITPEEYKVLKNEAKVLEKANAEEIQAMRAARTYAPLILNWVRDLPQDKEERRRQARILLYINYLLNFRRANDSHLNNPNSTEPNALSGIPEDVLKHLKAKFAEVQTNDRGQPIFAVPTFLKDKLLSYVFVLCLMLNQYKFAFEELTTMLKMKPDRATEHFRALGCRISSRREEMGDEMDTSASATGSVKLAVLGVPLQFPRPRGRRSKK
ncbi:hypothetical protein CAOG_00674 [Capsaspora owczarzaki ATCC 30864]|uniref:RNA polymerase I associated factor, A49-like protein n=1 Tax=Capsaspora owczarzaki (strain ATCC 30864) TaxID=595528 RepID=A0A0D2U1T8_CAPO3|nr:hypothetical protein CAOG_00674 [Capsaspora owczarzaki ATCC 30864]KJE89141.1 hypothetical protein CAOG_000674 [Capsaspora owczarzaki ATCC 30864]|eukprot:XP_004365545.2 hypothetical protein CAOG_00674 [Capsaspora owczarzaki ATCC 30864]